ncbi:hypothetical protein HQ529_04270 [Candidatus Woesearchaeota archaeon]|nr:hypothetical protein [Candidatus Woesearchaeota archaeon]
MINPELTEYVERVLDMGFSKNKIIETMVNKGYDKNNVRKIISEVLKTKKPGKGLFHTKIIDIGHEEFTKKIDKKIIRFVEKEVERGYTADQISSILIEEGYDEKTARKLIDISKNKKKKHDLLHKLTNEIVHLKDIEYSFMPDKKWLRDLSVLLFFLALISTIFYFKAPNFFSFLIKLKAFVIVIPISAYILYVKSKEYNERSYKDAFLLTAVIATAVFIIDLIAPFYVVIISLPFLFYLFTHLIEKNYEIRLTQAFKLSTWSFLSGAVSIYLILALVGLITGILGILTL